MGLFLVVIPTQTQVLRRSALSIIAGGNFLISITFRTINQQADFSSLVLISLRSNDYLSNTKEDILSGVFFASTGLASKRL
jgi:hypothetical protein